LDSLDILFWNLFQTLCTLELESQKMSDTNLLIIAVFVFCLLVAGLFLMVREFMGQASEAFPDVNEWLDQDKKKKK
jgi:H+/Cl- antiporter ClcA